MRRSHAEEEEGQEEERKRERECSASSVVDERDKGGRKDKLSFRSSFPPLLQLPSSLILAVWISQHLPETFFFTLDPLLVSLLSPNLALSQANELQQHALLPLWLDSMSSLTIHCPRRNPLRSGAAANGSSKSEFQTGDHPFF